MRLPGLVFVLSILSASCASPPVQPSYYLLRSDTGGQFQTSGASQEYALGNVVTAAYLNQPGMLLEMENGNFKPAAYHLWAEPLHESVRNYLRLEISRGLGKDLPDRAQSNAALVADVRIDQLHGTHDGQAKLVAYLTLRRGTNVLKTLRFTEHQALSEDGYGALAEAQKRLLSRLAERVTASLIESGVSKA